MLGFSDVSFNYPDSPTLFQDLNFGIDMDSRLAMVGPNGELMPYHSQDFAWHTLQPGICQAA